MTPLEREIIKEFEAVFFTGGVRDYVIGNSFLTIQDGEIVKSFLLQSLARQREEIRIEVEKLEGSEENYALDKVLDLLK